MTDPWLLLSYGRRPAGDVSAGVVPVLGALGAGVNTATAALRADRDLADRRALAELMTGSAVLAGQQQVSQAEADRVLRIAVAEALLRSQAAQRGQAPPAGPPPAAAPPNPVATPPSPSPPAPSAPRPPPSGAAAVGAVAVVATGAALAVAWLLARRRR